MINQENQQTVSQVMHELINNDKTNSEALSILATELIEIKSLIMALIDLQKSALFATGVSETELETNVQTLINGYRRKFLNNLTEQIREKGQGV
jgi:cytochrome c-type biogenesis protein CcmH/NrfG